MQKNKTETQTQMRWSHGLRSRRRAPENEYNGPVAISGNSKCHTGNLIHRVIFILYSRQNRKGSAA